MAQMNGALSRAGVALVGYDWLTSNFRGHQVFHVHWPDAVVMGSSRLGARVKFALFMGSVWWARLLRRRIVYSVHNLASHDQLHPALERRLWRMFLPTVDAFHHMNSGSLAILRRNPHVRQGAQHALIPHPHYREHVQPGDQSIARRGLGLSEAAFVILLFGQLRPYKGIEGAIDAFRASAIANLVLLIAGKPSSDSYEAAVRERIADDPRIVLLPRFIDDDDLKQLLAACDVVLLNHTKVNNSGVAIMALSADRPILAPKAPAIEDLERDVGAPWVTTFTGLLDAEAFALVRNRAAGIDPTDRPDLRHMDPDIVAAQLVRLYRGEPDSAEEQPTP